MDIIIPDVLSSYAAFQQWIEGSMSGLQGHDKGNPWQEFAKNLLPLTDFGKNFHDFKDNPRKTHDKGWDLKATGISDNDTRALFVQTKFSESRIGVKRTQKRRAVGGRIVRLPAPVAYENRQRAAGTG